MTFFPFMYTMNRCGVIDMNNKYRYTFHIRVSAANASYNNVYIP